MEEHPPEEAEDRDAGTPRWSKAMRRIFPFLRWFQYYDRAHLRADFVAGLTVALVLIPQSMAYAQLAGLPVYYGLYAALLPPLVAALFGSSHQLATGPVAVVSMMTATALAPLASTGCEAFIAYAILLALLVGLFQFLLGVFRLGLVVNFLSHPVVNGFTNAAALIIATSQLSKLFGVDVVSGKHQYETVYRVILAALKYTHWPTFAFAVGGFGIMYFLRRLNRRLPNVLIAVVLTTFVSWLVGFEHNRTIPVEQIQSLEVRNSIGSFNFILDDLDGLMAQKVALRSELLAAEETFGSKSFEATEAKYKISRLDLRIEKSKEELCHFTELLQNQKFVGVNTPDGKLEFYPVGQVPAGLQSDGRKWSLKVRDRRLNEEALTFVGGGAVVGKVPRGLPIFSPPKLDFGVIPDLISMVVIISLLGFMEAISIAKAIAAKTGQRLDPNQELIGQGLANIVGSFSQSYPVSGSFSRSAVNLSAGAVTGFSSAFSSLVVLVTLLFLTPMLYHLPQSVLAAVIIMAVINLLNVKGIVHAWHAQKYDGAIAVITFFSTLIFAPHLDKGIMIGVVLSLGYYLFSNIKPSIATLALWKDGTYRDADRRGLEKCLHIAVIRFNNSLFFANVNYLEEVILERIAKKAHLRHIHIVGNGMNVLDASGEEMLSQLVGRVREAGYDISLSGLNEHVLATMRRTHLYEKIGADHIFGNVALAIQSIHRKTHINSPETRCPLLEVVPREEGVPETNKKRRFSLPLEK